MKLSCGTDIIEINRIKDAIESLGNTFLNKIYTQNEIEYCEAKKNNKYQHYAVRFSAKEAVFKAVSFLFHNKYDLSWKNIEIVNNEQGKPSIQFIDIELDKVEDIHISLSHCKDYATAMVVVQYKE